ncbi:uncharacterized protein CIMG_11119 [Coccidioides immitis RS]|uniref:Uncharacterized protein n=3 Tax=Coccidioides immitis TaxID=5501 RepID=J3KBC9_COCIM|nr:uncharacterized protein CIMG_11119 [Coccidioides immitis RS]EAS32414.3 hypothetical protein CIMG_11119 [Coccidioides immitis RS]KMP07647.1 hypothetical protein CIRG_07328 [Coccidioides immitis RMSCC 2394]KMU71902.1 hypothetical protein CISG_00211 [Coccidioides immitis RMSCC 3703]TPX19546.1 hypothetical protein DIZ76_017338 [Coccidioides immitis]
MTISQRCTSSGPRKCSQAAVSTACSINEIVRLNCREQLILEPLRWTGRHVELLQCRFEKPSLAPSVMDSTNKGPGDRFVRALVDAEEYIWREFRTRQILSSPGCPFTALNNLPFYFDRRHISDLPCVVFFPKGDHDRMARGLVPAVAAYVDRARIDHLRLAELYRYQGRRQSEHGSTLFRLKSKEITSPEHLHDPYILALLIAMAQLQRGALRRRNPEKQLDMCSTFACRVLLTDLNDKACTHLFTADISSSFLQKLDLPASRPSASASPFVSIQHTKIPYKPYNTFCDRISSLLLRGYPKRESRE